MRLPRELLDDKLDCEDLTTISGTQLAALFASELGDSPFLPHGYVETDPRTGDRVVYNSRRANRPRDNGGGSKTGSPASCVICEGKITRLLDIVPLSEGFTFINKNLYPILFPRGSSDPSLETSWPVRGLHFLQWSSSLHDRDVHNLPLDDLEVVVARLAELERLLIEGGVPGMPDNASWGDSAGRSGFVGIIKNVGRLVGGSLAHGHQQITVSDVMPRRQAENLRFFEQHGEPFSAYLLRENPAVLSLAEYGAARLVVPHFMKRALEMMLLLDNTERRYLFELESEELRTVARGLRDGIRVIRALMPTLGREIAFNIITHNGPGAGLYFEFLPYTQEMGGYEQLGLFSCQAGTEAIAGQIREFLQGDRHTLKALDGAHG
jgi:galactose-1-phosphate uridylyltransferase